MLLERLLKKFVKRGTLRLIDHTGNETIVGEDLDATSPLTIRLNTSSIGRKVLLNPGLHMPEGYLNGEIDVENGTIYDFLLLLEDNKAAGGEIKALRLNKIFSKAVRALRQFNPAKIAARNARHHYDISEDLYRLFLDPDMQYSCGYFENESDSLETAQIAKKRHIAAKLMIEPGMRVLDIGCGWGGMGLYLAKEFGAQVVGVTLSPEQHRVAVERTVKEGLNDQVDFRVQDYRAVEGPFDRIVSVGMFEHVGINHYDAYFQSVRDLLTDDGVALIHTIARANGPSASNPFIMKYIFPGSYSPAMSEILPAIERTHMSITDIEILRKHYGLTCGHWKDRFAANRDKAEAIYDDRFCRMWEFYLATSELVFTHGSFIVAQFQLSKQKHTVPQTRGYIGEIEAKHPL